jgi:Rrf2 family protein
MLTMKTRYALKALTLLAEAGQGAVVLSGDLAEREGIPKKFLEAILRELRMHGVLSSQRGRGGGYSLREPPEQIQLVTIVRALDGPIAPVPCLSKTAYARCAECKSETTCGVRFILKDLHDATLKILEGTTLADLARKTREAAGQENKTLRYAI